MNESKVLEYATYIITCASILHASLPPVSYFDAYPRVQKAYQLTVNIIGWIAVNWRGQVQDRPSISVGHNTTINAVPTENTGTIGEKHGE